MAVTLWAEVPAAAVITNHSKHRLFPGCRKFQEVGFFSIRQPVLVVFVAIEVATQAACLALVVSRDSDSNLEEQVVGHPQAKVGCNDIVVAFFVDLHLSFIEVEGDGCGNAVQLENTKKQVICVK